MRSPPAAGFGPLEMRSLCQPRFGPPFEFWALRALRSRTPELRVPGVEVPPGERGGSLLQRTSGPPGFASLDLWGAANGPTPNLLWNSPECACRQTSGEMLL
eukprot:8088229-Alexandrium_andersonii.AAC.1